MTEQEIPVCEDCQKPCIIEKDLIAHFANNRCASCEAAMFAAMQEDGWKAEYAVV